MNVRTLGLGIVLADFTALTAYALYRDGLTRWIALATSTASGLMLGADLLIALSLVTVWMVRDARARGASVAPYLVLTAATGSVGPLLYLFVRALRSPADEGARPHEPAAVRP